MIGDKNDDDSRLREHLFTRANATLINPGKPNPRLLPRTVTDELKAQKSHALRYCLTFLFKRAGRPAIH
jgi:hypothetical protein